MQCIENIVEVLLTPKLRCYTGISGPEKSCNNTREKISYFYFQTHLSSFLSVISGLLKALKENSTKLLTTGWDLMAFHGRLVHRAECPLFS